MKKFNAFIQVVSIAPLLVLIGLALSYLAYRVFPMPLIPHAGDNLLSIGAFIIIVATLLILSAERISRLMHRTIQNAVCADFMQGPYRFSRHPGALGLMLMYVGFVLVVNSLVMAIIAVVFILLETLVFIPMEEDMLIMQCPNAYREYKTKVRMWF